HNLSGWLSATQGMLRCCDSSRGQVRASPSRETQPRFVHHATPAYTRRVKAVQLVAPQVLKFVDVPAPTPTSGQVLVRMDYLAVCGSDLKFYDRTMPETMYPMDAGRPCHECVGTVEVSTVPQFQPGQRVIALIQTGGLVERAVLPAELLVALPDA